MNMRELYRDACNISKEESIYKILDKGELERGVARCLASHPQLERMWKEDVIELSRLEKETV